MMKSKEIVVFVLLLLACIIACLLLTGCGAASVETTEQFQEQKTEIPSMFVMVERSKTWCIVYHRETKVMYAVSNSGYNCGNFTVLVNADGSPMLWEG